MVENSLSMIRGADSCETERITSLSPVAYPFAAASHGPSRSRLPGGNSGGYLRAIQGIDRSIIYVNVK